MKAFLILCSAIRNTKYSCRVRSAYGWEAWGSNPISGGVDASYDVVTVVRLESVRGLADGVALNSSPPSGLRHLLSASVKALNTSSPKRGRACARPFVFSPRHVQKLRGAVLKKSLTTDRICVRVKAYGNRAIANQINSIAVLKNILTTDGHR